MKTLNLSLITVGGILLAGAPAEAISLDLTAGTSSGTINSAFFIRTDSASTGSGVISSFVRLAQSGNNTSAEGYNADARPVMGDVNTSGTFTRDLRLSAVPLVTNPLGQIGQYYEFLLDINQNKSDPFLSLDQIQIYTKTGALATANTLAALTGSGASLRYNLDANVNSELLLNYNLNSGSGSGDLFAYIPVGAFGGAVGTDFVYLYSQFGAKGVPYDENDGFEEWSVREGATVSVPDGGTTVALLGMALGGIGMARRLLGKKA